MNQKTILLIGTLDTKAEETIYLKHKIEENSLHVLLVDIGVSAPTISPDISLISYAEGLGLNMEPIKSNNPLECIETLGNALRDLVRELISQELIHGAIALGGGWGTSIAAEAMRTLPMGMPKLMVSTVTYVSPATFVGINDTLAMDPMVDIAGLNYLLCQSLNNAAAAISAMVFQYDKPLIPTRPCIALSAYGVTSVCATQVRLILEAAGYEILVFYGTGLGGTQMEHLIRAGIIKGVVDLTTTEVGQYYLGGLSGLLSSRLEAAGDMGIPQIVSVGGLDIVNFASLESVPERYKAGYRKFLRHNPSTTLMRTLPEENEIFGRIIAQKLNRANGVTKVVLPLKGISSYDIDGDYFRSATSDQSLFNALKQSLLPKIPVIEVDAHINDSEFARRIGEISIETFQSCGIPPHCPSQRSQVIP